MLAGVVAFTGGVAAVVAPRTTKGPVLTVTPDTGLAGGDTVSVTGSGLAPHVYGAIVECNAAPNEPTISVPASPSVPGSSSLTLPVGCIPPYQGPYQEVYQKAQNTLLDGQLPATELALATGTIGPPASGTDSSGGSASADAAGYPCPPTPAQQAAGVTCVIAFMEFANPPAANGDAAAGILFEGESAPSTTTTSSTTSPSSTTTTTAPTSCTPSVGSVTTNGATLSVDPATCLSANMVLALSGSGFHDNSTGGILECNAAPGEPTISVFGNNVPVGCTNPSKDLVTTGSTGTVSGDFTVVTGTIGPPGTGTDSSGGSASADAASYPCPPTAAQLAAGVTCVIVYGDLNGDKVIVPISFASQSTTTTTTSTTTTSTTSPSSTTTSTTSPSSTTTSSTSSTTSPSSTTTTTAPTSCTPSVGSVTTNGATLSVDPATCLSANMVLAVSGSGFHDNSTGGILECNAAPGEPTISVFGNNVPVGCTNPSKDLVTTGSTGTVSGDFTVVTGTIGPPGTGTDSSGGSASADAASYPCPPTAAQLAAGVTCVIVYGDLNGDKVIVPISFASVSTTPTGVTTTTTSPATSTTASSSTLISTSASSSTPTTSRPSSLSPASAPSPGGALAFTGIGPGLWWLALLGLALVELGYLVWLIDRPPRWLRKALAACGARQE
ncbi:MAG: hypothetical protein M0035_15535 [Actinomycetota bacterium]|nr:hypothetical protein [Actinomycetota bacterium]